MITCRVVKVKVGVVEMDRRVKGWGSRGKVVRVMVSRWVVVLAYVVRGK